MENTHVVWDIVSMSLMVFYAYPWIKYVMNHHQPKFLFMGIGMVLCEISTKLIKKISHPWGAPFARPKGARNCNILCNDGDRSGMPGFVSGHCSAIAFFFTYLWLISNTDHKNNVLVIGVVCAGLTSYARHVKRCHNLLQIVSGIVFGAVFAYVWWFILRTHHYPAVAV